MTDGQGPDQADWSDSHLNRGQFLKGAAAGGALLAGLAGGAGTADAAVRSLRAPLAPKPKRGGTLRVGCQGGGTSETFNPAVLNSPIDSLHGYSVYDPLTRIGPNFNFEPGLAVDWVPNKTATEWEIHLRKGVHWHDGKPFTADDVIYSLQLMGSPDHFGHYAVSAMDTKHLSKRGKYIVKAPMHRPQAQLAPLFAYFTTLIVQDGTKNFNKVVGTGPFKLKSFTPGQQSSSVRNDDYWDHGKPYVDQLVVTSLSDPTTAVDALQANQFDAVFPVLFPVAAAKQKNPASSTWQLMVQNGGFAQTLYMRADKPPFNNAKVREAMKLIMDRPKAIDVVFNGFGEPGNDLFCKHQANYDNGIPQRKQDIEKAKSLLKSAGMSDLKVTLQTSEALPGLTDAAAFYAQQAKMAGVSVDVKTVNPAAYLNPTLQYLKMLFAQDSWALVSLSHAYNLLAGKDAPTNEGHYIDADFSKLVAKAQSSLNRGDAQHFWNQAQHRFWSDSSYIVWGLRHSLTGMAPNLHGWGNGWLLPLDDQKTWEWYFA